MKRYAYLSALILIVVFVGVSLASVEANNADSDTITTSNGKDIKKTHTPVAAERGQLLYENHCTACHEKSVHGRNHYKANSINDIRQWVIRWSNNLELGWERNDVNVVTDFLNQRYYHLTTEE